MAATDPYIAPPMSEAIIRVRDLTVAFGSRKVLDGLNLDVARGEILGFVGASGAGKSVLMRTIIGLVPKVSGKIKVFGTDLEYWQQRDPAFLARNLEKDALAIYIDCGTEDRLRLQHGASYLPEVLEERGIAHEFILAPGGHERAFWREHLDDSLTFHMRHLAKPR